MISEGQQEQAALYALGSLDADEASSFERAMAADGELGALAGELSETAAALARTGGEASPPPLLKARVLAGVRDESRSHPEAGNVTAGPRSWMNWVPWTLAAALAVCCGVLGSKYLALEEKAGMDRYAAAFLQADALRQISYCPLEPVPAARQAGPQAGVVWDAAHRRGRLQITGLPAAGEGKDYQLWTVEAGRQDPVSAGLVKVGADDSAAVEFQPEGDDGKARVVAFAVSRERAGGVPKSEGPILFLGKLSP